MNHWICDILSPCEGSMVISAIHINKLGLDHNGLNVIQTYKITNKNRWLKRLGVTLSNADFCTYEAFLIARDIRPEMDYPHKTEKGFGNLNKNKYKEEIIKFLVEHEEEELKAHIKNGSVPNVISYLCKRYKTGINVFKYNLKNVLVFYEDGTYKEKNINSVIPDGKRHLIWNVQEAHITASTEIFKGTKLILTHKVLQNGREKTVRETKSEKDFILEFKRPVVEGQSYVHPKSNIIYTIVKVYSVDHRMFPDHEIKGIDLTSEAEQKKRERENKVIRIFWDIETPHEKIQEIVNKSGDKVNKFAFYPISACLKVINQNVFNEALETTETIATLYKNADIVEWVKHLRSAEGEFYFYGKDCMLQLSQWIENLNNLYIGKNRAKIRFYAHGGGGFDLLYLHIYFSVKHEVDYLYKNGSYICLRVLNSEFVDSVQLIDGKLRTIAISYGVPVGKLTFPYKFMKRENLDYIGPVPPVEYWESEEERNSFIERKGNTFNFKLDLLEYNMQDAKVGAQIIEKYLKVAYVAGVKDTRSCITKSSAALKWFLQSEPQLHIEGVNEEMYRFFRRAYFGGLTQSYIPMIDTSIQGGVIIYLDFNSLYPSCMLGLFGTRWNTLNLNFLNVSDDYKYDDQAFYEVMWSCKSKDPHTRSPFGVDVNGVKIPVLNCEREEDAIVVSGIALNIFKSHFSFRVGEVYYPIEKKPLFRKFIQARYEERREYKKKMKEHADKKDEAYYAYNLLQENVKLCINSLYGVWGMVLDEKMVLLNKDAARVFAQEASDSIEGVNIYIEPIDIGHFKCSHDPECQDEECANETMYRIKLRSDIPKPSSGYFVSIAAQITWHAKAKIWAAMRDIGFNRVAYTDTDSLIVHLKEGETLPYKRREPGDESEEIMISDDYLGDLKEEYPDGGYLFHTAGPKLYDYYPHDTPKNRSMQKTLKPGQPVRPLIKTKGIKTELVKEGDILSILEGNLQKFTFPMMWHRKADRVEFTEGESRYVKFIKHKCVFQLTEKGEIDLFKPTYTIKNRKEAEEIFAFYQKKDKIQKDIAILNNKINKTQDPEEKQKYILLKNKLENEQPNGEYKRHYGA